MIEGDRLHFYMHNEMIADVPAESLVLGGGAPIYKREFKEPKYLEKIKQYSIKDIKEPADLKAVATELASHPNIASKKWIYNQYDSMVGTINMTTNRPSDAAVVDVRGTNKGLAMTVDCNPRYVNADPFAGCAIAVAEAARNISCSGAMPSAVTNCLNFGNPYNPEVYWQFVNAIKGMGEACTKFKTPVTGGNVSFYNQSMINNEEVPVFPTPTIGMIGILEDKNKLMTLNFKQPGDLIFLVGNSVDDISSSEYLYSHHKVKYSPAPYFNLDEEFEVQALVRKLIDNQLINAAHDVSDGGLFITLLESAMAGNIGFNIESDSDIRKDAFLFGEGQGRIVVSVSPEQLDEFIAIIADADVEFTNLGSTGGTDLIIDDESFGTLEDFRNSYDSAIVNKMN